MTCPFAAAFWAMFALGQKRIFAAAIEMSAKCQKRTLSIVLLGHSAALGEIHHDVGEFDYGRFAQDQAAASEGCGHFNI